VSHEPYLRSPAQAIIGLACILTLLLLASMAITPVAPAVYTQLLTSPEWTQKYDPQTGAFRVEWRPSWCADEVARSLTGRSTELYYYEYDVSGCSEADPLIARRLFIGYRPGDAEQFGPSLYVGGRADPFLFQAGVIEQWFNRAWLLLTVNVGDSSGMIRPEIWLAWHRALCGAEHSCNLWIDNGKIEFLAVDY
jgi:hypothetical protein